MKIIHKFCNKETLSYIFWGILATIISFVTYWLFYEIIHEAGIANVISWIICIIFQFWSNRNYVFNSKSKHLLRQFTKFTLTRAFTLIVEELILIVMVDTLHFNPLLIKIYAEIIVIILNYVLAKYMVF